MTMLRMDGMGPAPLTVATEGLAKRYGRAAVLDGIDLRIPEGAVYALLGANGAGKSTLLQILMNVIRADAGRARVLGLDVRQAGAQVRAQIGYVPESHALGYPWLRVGRLLAHHAVFHPTWDHAYADRLAQALAIRLDRRCGALSKGESRRVQLLIALAHRPPLLLLDELSDGLDHVGRDRTLSLLTEHLADSPTTMLISTHRAYEFEPLVDHVGVIQRGVLLVQTTRDRLQRTLRRYRADVPEGWRAPAELGDAATVLRRATLGRQIDWTVSGEEGRVLDHLRRAGAVVRDIASLSLDDAAVALLLGQEAR